MNRQKIVLIASSFGSTNNAPRICSINVIDFQPIWWARNIEFWLFLAQRRSHCCHSWLIASLQLAGVKSWPYKDRRFDLEFDFQVPEGKYVHERRRLFFFPKIDVQFAKSSSPLHPHCFHSIIALGSSISTILSDHTMDTTSSLYEF